MCLCFPAPNMWLWMEPQRQSSHALAWRSYGSDWAGVCVLMLLGAWRGLTNSEPVASQPCCGIDRLFALPMGCRGWDSSIRTRPAFELPLPRDVVPDAEGALPTRPNRRFQITLSMNRHPMALCNLARKSPMKFSMDSRPPGPGGAGFPHTTHEGLAMPRPAVQ